MRVNLWNTLPKTYTLVAKRGGAVIGTTTLICDSDAKLPTDEIAGPRLDELRRQGLRLAEVSGMAVHPTLSDSSTVIEMFRYLTMLSRKRLGQTDGIITVNPKHAAFYTKRLCFERISEEREYAKVKNAPGIAMRLNLETMPEVYRRTHGRRSSERNLHWFFFVDSQAKMAESIDSSLALRDKLLTRSFLLTFFRDRIGVLKNALDFETFRRQWDEVFDSVRKSARICPTPKDYFMLLHSL